VRLVDDARANLLERLIISSIIGMIEKIEGGWDA
jgi:hypothetical protein